MFGRLWCSKMELNNGKKELVPLNIHQVWGQNPWIMYLNYNLNEEKICSTYVATYYTWYPLNDNWNLCCYAIHFPIYMQKMCNKNNDYFGYICIYVHESTLSTLSSTSQWQWSFNLCSLNNCTKWIVWRRIMFRSWG